MEVLAIVEGDGDLAAVPELIRRVCHEHGRYDVVVGRPHKRGDLPKVISRLENYLEVALLHDCPILWVLDYDCDECTDVQAHLVELRKRAAPVVGQTRVEFVFMVKEFETLFLADHATTRRVFPDIPGDLVFPTDPETIRDAKGWLSGARPKGFAYKPTQHQARLTSQVDLRVLRRGSPSFQRFEAAVIRLISP
jgi:hypothetical protein